LEKGSDFKNPRMDFKSVNVDKSEVLKGIPGSMLEAWAKHDEYKDCGSTAHQWTTWKNAINITSIKKRWKDKNITVQTSMPEVSILSSMVKPRSLTDQIMEPAPVSSSQVLCKVDSDGMEINSWMEFLVSLIWSMRLWSVLWVFEVQTAPCFSYLSVQIFIFLWDYMRLDICGCFRFLILPIQSLVRFVSFDSVYTFMSAV
jgi:hypothetical protein